MNYKVVFVDWHGTLSNSRFWNRWINDEAKGEHYRLISKVLFESAEGELILNDWMRGLRSVDNVLHYVSNATAIPHIELKNELTHSAERVEFIDIDVLVKINKLRSKGIKVVIATDNMDIFRHITVPCLKLENKFDAILTSDTQGALKTDFIAEDSSLFFDEYLNQNSINRHEAVLIDDNEKFRVVEKRGIDFLHVDTKKSLKDHLEQLLIQIS